LTIDPVTKSNLADTAKWARFLAIVGMIVLVFIVIASMFGVTVMTATNNITYMGTPLRSEEMVNSMRLTLIGTTLVGVLIAFFPLLFLLQFANRMKRALVANDQNELNYSFMQLKRYFRYLGIVVIIVMACYLLFFLMMIIGMTAFSR
ncbi:MAG TPA: DUF5362 family protein, partial [Flavisolibacter sp.]|nr:DUF5362 family protein [Flavisolibacter sp.]